MKRRIILALVSGVIIVSSFIGYFERVNETVSRVDERVEQREYLVPYREHDKCHEILKDNILYMIFKEMGGRFFIDLSGKVLSSNAYLLETCLDWAGFCIEPDPIKAVDLIKNRMCQVVPEDVSWSLNVILKKYGAPKRIDFLSVGTNQDVLLSLGEYKVDVISLPSVRPNVQLFLSKNNYVPIASLCNSNEHGLFVKRDSRYFDKASSTIGCLQHDSNIEMTSFNFKEKVLNANNNEFITSADDVKYFTNKKLVYVITPTYERSTRRMELTRMVQALMLDGGIYWIVVEDSTEYNMGIRKVAYDTGLPFAHVLGKQKHVQAGHKGIDQRNIGLDIVRSVGLPGIIYFADDDNVYDYRLFEQLRSIKTVGLFATGYPGGANFERCVVNDDGVITGFLSGWPGGRRFQVDMGGFAINADILGEFRIPYTMKRGFIEDYIVSSFIKSPSEAQPIGNCTTVYFWHIDKPAKSTLSYINRMPKNYPKNEIMWASYLPPLT